MATNTSNAQKRAQRPAQPKNSSGKKLAFCILRRTLLVIVTLVLVLAIALVLILNKIFNGPSESAKETLTMTLLEASATKWVPKLFIGEAEVERIKNGGGEEFEELSDDDVDTSLITIDNSTSIAGNTDEWKDHPDGIRIERMEGPTFTAHIMIIRDPSRVYLATSTLPFSKDRPGMRITNAIEKEGAVAAINAGAFYDNGTGSSTVGSVPEGLVISNGEVVWTQNETYDPEGFVGFNTDNILIVDKSMTASRAKELNIRDGCGFGPVLIKNGEINEVEYNNPSGYNPRTAIGQRSDGAVIFVCIDGRQAGSLGGTYKDVIDIMVKYGAVNACNLDGGSSSVMLYRTTYSYAIDKKTTLAGDGSVVMINNYSLLQEQPRRMPTFYMVRPAQD